MRTNRLSLVRLALFAVLPLCMSDVESASAAPLDPNAGALSADAGPESGSLSSADIAPTSPGTTTGASQSADGTQSQTQAAEGGTAQTSEAGAPVNEDTGKVEVNATAHAEAKDRFAGLLAKLHQFEDEAIDELKTDLLAIATLLHLHTRASSSAATTGTYKPADLS
jgi:hypothetical protein